MGGKTRDLIKEVALRLFADNGYDATSIEQISSGAGIKKSSLYAFFTSKEALFWEIYEELENDYHHYMEQLLVESESMTPLERLHYLFKQYLSGSQTGSKQEAVVERFFWIRVMFFPPAAFKDKLLNRALNREMVLGERYKQIIEEGIRQGFIRQGSPEDVLLSYYSLRQGLYSLLNVFMYDMNTDQRHDRIDKAWHNFCLGVEADR